jgi:hypothetical protein
MVSRLGISRRRYAFKSTRKRFLVLLLVCVTLFLAGGSLFAYIQFNATYHHYFALAQTGMQHLRSGAQLLESLQSHPFEPRTVARAQQEFVDALSETQAIKQGVANYAGFAGIIPVLGPRLEATIHLSALAVDVSQAGISVCALLSILLAHYHNPMNAVNGSPLTQTDFKVLAGDVQEISAALSRAIDEAVQIRPEDVSFDARLPGLLSDFQAKIPEIRIALADVNQLLPVLPAMLGIGGSPANYLIEILDSTEIRPGGGFIGNYGILTVKGGQPLSPHITDIDLFDTPFKRSGRWIPYPASYRWFSRYLSPYSWSLHDSNLDADFPTAARAGEYTYQREGGSIQWQGVIAMTPAVIQRALLITGPIYIPEYHETVTAQNLIARIHYHQLGNAGEGPDYTPSPDGHSSLRKRFTELLAEHFMALVQHLPSNAVAKFMQVLVSSLQTKDIEVYFNANGAEKMLQLFHLSGTIQSPPGDHLFIVDTNVASNKANDLIVNTVHDQVSIDERGNAVHSTSISYAWTLVGQNYGNPLYEDYVRLYTPPGSVLLKQAGWQPYGVGADFGSRMWAGYFSLAQGQTHTITLVWISYGAAKKTANSGHYRYLVQRQAGIQRTLELQIAPPACAVLRGESGGLAPGKAHTFTMATLVEPEIQDIDVGLSYAC